MSDPSSQHDLYIHAANLVAVLQEMGKRHSNPVLEVLPQAAVIITEQKYPDPPFTFGNGNWRAFYHVHQPRQHPQEHGHFHLFTRIDDDDDQWGHVAALIMDTVGQPVQWCAVNHWVTGGPWLTLDVINTAIAKLSDWHDEPDLITKWLVGMLVMYAAEIQSLIRQRDAVITKQAQTATELFSNRDIYALAQQAIQLEEKLYQELSAG